MNQASLPTLLNEVREHPEEGTVFHVEVLDVGCTYPKGAPDLRDKREDFLEMGFVCNVVRHMCEVSNSPGNLEPGGWAGWSGTDSEADRTAEGHVWQ